MRHALTAAAALLATLSLAGCGTLEYQGTSASFRTLKDDPRADDYYVGANANFAVVPAGERAAPPAVVYRRDPLDVWNTPVTDPGPTPADQATASITADGK